VKVGHRQTPCNQQSPPCEGFVVYSLSNALVLRVIRIYGIIAPHD
jgi:hypothetical protein